MDIAHSVAEILTEHVTLEVESIDRMYLNLYVPRLQYEGGVVGFFRHHRGQPFASSALMAPMSTAFVAAIENFVELNGIPLIRFEKGHRKDDVAPQHFARFAGDEGVVFVGQAQEKTAVLRTTKRRNPITGQSYPWLVRSTAMVNHYYFYIWDRDFGPLFLKFGSYFPYPGKVCLNGHEYAKQQLTKRGIPYEALDNGIRSCADPKRLQAICDGLGAAQIEAVVRKWLGRVPQPFRRADRDAGYRYALSILQAEFSLTQGLDHPLTGRLFFEQVIRENLDLGRPDQVQLIFERRVGKRTPGRFRTRVVTTGVCPPCTSTTNTAASSSTTRTGGACAPRRRSTTRVTSALASGSTTSPRCGRSAFKPTDVCSTSNASATIATWARQRGDGSQLRCRSMVRARPRCISTIPVRTPYSACWWSSRCCPRGLPTRTCASVGRICSVVIRAPSPRAA